MPIYSTIKITVNCDYCNQNYSTSFSQYINGHKIIHKDCCSKCAGKKASEVSRMKRARKVFDKLYKICKEKDYILLTPIYEYTNEKMIVDIWCAKHGIIHMSIDSLLHGHECLRCSYEKRGNNLKLSNEEVRMIIESQNNNIWLNFGEYINNQINNLQIQCNCGNLFYTSLSNYSTQNRCSTCSQRESNGEKIIREYLESKNIYYIQEKRFNDCRDIKPLPFDFYLPDYNLIIEFDGEQHFEPKFGMDSLLKTQEHDRIKNQYCIDNNINIIRIPYWNGGKIKQIINDEIDKRNSLIS